MLIPRREGSPSIDYNAPIEHTPAISTPTIPRRAAYTTGSIDGQCIDILLDSGASCSVVHSNYILLDDVRPLISVTLVNADGSSLSPSGTTTEQVALNGLDTSHNFIVVNNLSTPVILGCDFLYKHGVLLDFGMNTFHCKNSCAQPKRLNVQTESLNMLVLDDDLPQAVPCPV